ncbi:MAG: hypothetical protein KA508_00580 [Gammaproteobacteria bacterium]|nr:hypothetical protein [Gammaproteobacteria bacterium]
MLSRFPDTSDTDYDDAIKKTSERMQSDSCTPCKKVKEVDFLVHRLKQIREEYYTRPCLPGYCGGVFTPHKSRIDARIKAFESERALHEGDCHDELRRESQTIDRERERLQYQHQLELERIREEGIARHTLEERQTTTTETRRTGSDHSPRR